MQALLEPNAAVAPAGYSACDICESPDVLSLGTCASCARGGTEALLFVEASGRRADREGFEAWLVDALGGAVTLDAARDVAEGVRPIVGLPEVTAGRAAATLSMRGVSAVAVSKADAWRRIPRGLLALAGAAAGMGLFLGLTGTAAMFVLGPVFGALLILAAARKTTEPIWIPEVSPVFSLPLPIETRVRSTLASLPSGRARDRLKDIVAVAIALGSDAEAPSTDDLTAATSELLSLSCRAVVDLDQFDRSLAVLEREPVEDEDPGLAAVVHDAIIARQALVHHLDHALATLVRAQTATSGDPAELLRAAERLSDEVALRADAWREVQRYT